MKIRDILDQHGITYKSEGRNTRQGWLQLTCPNCKGEDYLGINTSGGYANCWRCGKLKLADVVATLARISTGQAATALKGLQPEYGVAKAPAGRLSVPYGVGPLQPAHIRYLRGRGFDCEELVRLWGIGGIGVARRLQWRVYIPIYRHGKQTSWTTRAISDTVQMRYSSARLEEEAYPHKQTVYGLDYVRHACIVHEGPLDVWKVGPGAVCTFGLSYSPAQINAISRVPVRAICFDNEPEAQRRAEKLAADLAVFEGETYNVTLDSNDPGSATEKEIMRLRHEILGV